MDRASFQEKFQELTADEDPYGLRNTVGLSEEGVAQAEEDLQAKFPADFVWFLMNYWTGMFDTLDLYTLQRGDRSYIGSRQPEGVLGKYVAFSDDGFGNAFCFPVAAGLCEDRVVVVPLLASEFTGETVEGGILDFIASRA